MNFINPSFLWALFALAIPILIHLFHFRRYKTVLFSNVKFLKEVKQERNNIRQIKRWLLLLSRLFALGFLVLAFAQPFLKGKNATVEKTNAVSIYLDNSYSMGLKNKGVELIEWGRDRSIDIINSYSERDQFLILTNELSIDEQRWKTKEDALNYIDEIVLSSKTVPLDKVINKQQYLFTKSSSAILKNYIVSDFQKSVIENAKIKKDSLEEHFFIQMTADNVKNIYIDSVWSVDPISIIGSNNSILYKIKNSSELDAKNVRVKLNINDQVQTIRELNLIADEERIDTLYFNIGKEGWQLAEISITDYPITIDDQFYFSFFVAKSKKVLEIYDAATPNIIRSVYAKDEYIDFKRSQSNQLDYSTFQQYDLIVLNELEKVSSGLANSIEKYINAGGNTLLIPSQSTNEDTYANVMGKFSGLKFGETKEGNYQLKRPNLNSNLLSGIVEQYPKNLAMPSVKKYFPQISNSRLRSQNILNLNNGESLLKAYPKSEGNLFVQSVPNSVKYSDYQSHWLYAPIAYNLALAKGLDQALYQIGGQNNWVGVSHQSNNGDNVVTLSGASFEFIPEQRIINNRLFVNTSKNDQISAGHYKISSKEKLLSYLSFNLDRIESEMKFANTDELKNQFPNVAEITSGVQSELVSKIKLRNQGKPLWRLCLILALLFIIIEVAIIKLMPN